MFNADAQPAQALTQARPFGLQKAVALGGPQPLTRPRGDEQAQAAAVLQQAFVAQRLEKRYTKNEILELYLNRIFFGSGNGQQFYGVESAARGYFGKGVKNLTIEESATIVGLIKAPNLYSPLKHSLASIKARNLVFHRMMEEGYISPERITELAQALGVSRGRVEGVVGFYAFFSSEPRGRFRVLFSDNITDEMAGSQILRQRLLDAVAASPVRDTLVASGDVHSFWAADLKRDFDAANAPTLATEFVGGSITSQGAAPARVKALLARNPALRYGLGGRYGYAQVALTPKAATVSFRVVDTVKEPTSGIATIQRFAVEAGRPGVSAP